MMGRSARCSKCRKVAQATDVGRCPVCGDVILATVSGPPIPFSMQHLAFVRTAIGFALLGTGGVLVFVNGFTVLSIFVIFCAVVALAGVVRRSLGI